MADGSNELPNRPEVLRYLNLKLEALGLPHPPAEESDVQSMAKDLLANYRQIKAMRAGVQCPIDARIQAFLTKALGADAPRLPTATLELNRHGLARELSLPWDGDTFTNEILTSVRILQGVVHNPKSDRRTTAGVFHVTDYGLPVPGDKLAVPVETYKRLLARALAAPEWLTTLPYTASLETPAHCWVSLMLRPLVSPEVPSEDPHKYRPRKTMEVRFFAPASLVANLDFVESIFGNAGDPMLPENDAAGDQAGWAGTTGCVIVAPHLPGATKKELGLPHISQATEHQKRQSMCWKDDGELYNDGKPFKITLRSVDGVMVTILGDNYFGYCKKEVKTQISFTTNLTKLGEEEHAGGALVFPSYVLGEHFELDSRVKTEGHTFATAMAVMSNAVTRHDEGYATDNTYPDIVYVPEDVKIDLSTQRVSWKVAGRDQAGQDHAGQDRSIKLLPGKTYVLPSGYKVRLEKHPGAPSWRLVGTVAEGSFCHKPCTVSGGGKSEISKSIGDSIVYGPVYVGDFDGEMDAVEALLNRDYSDRMLPALRQDYAKKPSRPILSPERSLGSVIKLFTPSPGEYTDAYNVFLRAIPNQIRALVFLVKRFYKEEWKGNWRQHFSVNEINGEQGHELLYQGRKLVGSYLRIGFSPDGLWRLYKLRQDFVAADKVQMEDDISASTVVPIDALPNLSPHLRDKTHIKLVENCEYRLFQRPDEAIHRGYDKQTEADMAAPGLFCSNFEPLAAKTTRDIVDDAVGFEQFTPPVKDLLRRAADKGDGYVVCSAMPRIIDGKPSKNPRYLQTRPDVSRPREKYLADVGARLFRQASRSRPVVWGVNSVLAGRRNNPPEEGVRPLCVYGPIHYQELPELFMDFICSLTGKSPSTTGAGSEGAMTKGPFNAVRTTADLNAALISYILCGHDGFTSAAGYVGPMYRVDHDLSLLLPELWARLSSTERSAAYLMEHGHLEQLKDFEDGGRVIPASRLGWRITTKFVHTFFGRIFDSPATVFPEPFLKPEMQDRAVFVDGVLNIAEAQQRVAEQYLQDGSIEDAAPPIAALLHIMAKGDHNGMTVQSPELRAMFTRKWLESSEFYAKFSV